MKKLLIVCGLVLLGLQSASAQSKFRVGAGVGVGTTGIVIDASATYGEYLGARFGVDIFPKITVNTDLDLKTEDANKQVSQLTSEIKELDGKLAAAGMQRIDLNQYPGGNLPDKMDVEGKWTNTTWHLLFDVYPFGSGSSFHATIGAYFGPSDIVSVYNKDDGFLKPITAYNNAIINASTNADVQQVVNQYGLKMIGAELGDYFITPNPADNGNVEATIKVNGFRPYLGIGFGRAVPKKRIGCQFDLGVQFWGSPKVYAPTYEKNTGKFQYEQLEDTKAGGDGGDVIKTISKISVYPTLNFRLVGRIL